MLAAASADSHGFFAADSGKAPRSPLVPDGFAELSGKTAVLAAWTRRGQLQLRHVLPSEILSALGWPGPVHLAFLGTMTARRAVAWSPLVGPWLAALFAAAGAR